MTLLDTSLAFVVLIYIVQLTSHTWMGCLSHQIERSVVFQRTFIVSKILFHHISLKWLSIGWWG